MNKREQKMYGRIGGLKGGPLGGKMTGPTKRRGDSAYYSELAKRGARKRQALREGA